MGELTGPKQKASLSSCVPLSPRHKVFLRVPVSSEVMKQIDEHPVFKELQDEQKERVKKKADEAVEKAAKKAKGTHPQLVFSHKLYSTFQVVLGSCKM